MAVDPRTSARFGFFYGDALYGTDPAPLPVRETPVQKGDAVFDGDALFFETGDGGETYWAEGEPLRSGGLCNAYYLSWFGGNHTDSGLPADTAGTWWGNLLGEGDDFQYRGQLEKSLNELALTSANVAVLQAIAAEDVAWLLRLGVATSHEISITIVGPNRVRVQADVLAEGQKQTFTFFENWNARS